MNEKPNIADLIYDNKIDLLAIGKQLGLSDSTLLAIFTGGFVREQDIDAVLKAISELLGEEYTRENVEGFHLFEDIDRRIDLMRREK